MTAPRLEDYEILSEIGRGSFGSVSHAIRKSDGKEVAIKIVEKAMLQQENRKHQAMRERDYMKQTSSTPGFVRLFTTFHDAAKLYYVMEYYPKGDLTSLISRYGRSFPFELARIHAAELVFILERLRQFQLIHRDLKPSNILITSENHLVLTDFGSAKHVQEPTNSFVGTAAYVSPEMLDNQEVTFAADYWALGCILFEMLTGKPPFKAITQELTFDNIRRARIEFPEHVPVIARDFITRLVIADPSHRLGVQDFNQLKENPFFEGISIDNIFETKVPEISSLIAPPKPKCLCTGIVKLKKSSWNSKTVRLVLTDTPQLVFYYGNNDELSEEITISERLRVEKKENKLFSIVVPGAKYRFKEPTGNAHVWVRAIRDMLFKQYLNI